MYTLNKPIKRKLAYLHRNHTILVRGRLCRRNSRNRHRVVESVILYCKAQLYYHM